MDGGVAEGGAERARVFEDARHGALDVVERVFVREERVERWFVQEPQREEEPALVVPAPHAVGRERAHLGGDEPQPLRVERLAQRRGDGAVLTLSDGAEIPGSRANLRAVRAAGLLPR